MTDLSLLDNVIWHTLSGSHAHFAVGTADARCYAAGFPPLAGFAEAEHPDFAALARVCEPGQPYFCDGWSGRIPGDWRVERESTMFKMVWDGAPPAPDPEGRALIPLGPPHAGQAFELAMLTRPGPFGPRTTELGDYFGLFDGDRLIAMAGERLWAGRLREISGVCTHPDFLGRGYARRLVNELIRREMQRGEVPFLHVMHDNERAHRLYRHMGFRDYRETVVRVVTRR